MVFGNPQLEQGICLSLTRQVTKGPKTSYVNLRTMLHRLRPISKFKAKSARKPADFIAPSPVYGSKLRWLRDSGLADRG